MHMHIHDIEYTDGYDMFVFHRFVCGRMSHSSLAMQWESVGSIRDKARRLELVTCPIFDNGKPWGKVLFFESMDLNETYPNIM